MSVDHRSSVSLALLGGLLGLCGPIYALTRKRRTNQAPATTIRQPSDRSDPLLHTPEPKLTANAEESLHAARPSDGHEWFYTQLGKSIGPVSTTRMHELLTVGTIGRTTQVWRKGFADWQSLTASELFVAVPKSEPPPLASSAIVNAFIWALTFAPLWGTILHYVFVYIYVIATTNAPALAAVMTEEIVDKTWQADAGISIAMAVLDERALRAAGWKSDRVKWWYVVLVPLYIYKRDQLVGADMTRLWIWFASVAAVVFLF